MMQVGKSVPRWLDNIKLDLGDAGCEDVKWAELKQM
jgi:hypothetical protein